MAYVKINYIGWTDSSSALFNVKRLKEITGWGLREAKDYYDRINFEIRSGFILIDTQEGHYQLLRKFMSEDLLTFEIEGEKPEEPKKENHRVIAKNTKEYEKAKAWADSLHPKKRAMIQILLNSQYGI